MTNPRFRSTIHGWLVLDKPLGLTSTQALGKARRLLGGTKAGHGGTLDPLATGVLPLAFGEATKLIPYIMDGNKEYEFTIFWGENRTTDDAEGKVTTTSTVRPSESQIRAKLSSFIGTVLQKPPAFSAIKIAGERAYDLARAGELVELAEREVLIHSLDLVACVDANHASFRVSCGKGMYVRSLARDLAAQLGTCGYVSALRRTKVGSFSLEEATSMKKLEDLGKEKITSTALLPIKAALGSVSILQLTETEAHTLRLGKKILIRPQHGDILNTPVLFAEHDGVPIALLEPKAGELRVLRGFHF
jgi:tRNA pseudouridine55 synthase